jgi:hypothetical protein
VGDLLIWAGTAVGVGGAVLMATGAWVSLPMSVVILIAKALPFVVAAALLTPGAIVRRSALRAPLPPATHDAPLPPATHDAALPPAHDVAARPPARTEVRR